MTAAIVVPKRDFVIQYTTMNGEHEPLHQHYTCIIHIIYYSITTYTTTNTTDTTAHFGITCYHLPATMGEREREKKNQTPREMRTCGRNNRWGARGLRQKFLNTTGPVCIIIFFFVILLLFRRSTAGGSFRRNEHITLFYIVIRETIIIIVAGDPAFGK